MDLEEMKTGWNVLNERLIQNEILNQKIIKKMIMMRTQSAYEKVYNSELRGLCLVLAIGIVLLPLIKFVGDVQMKCISFILLETIMCFAVIYQAFMVYYFSRFSLDTLKMQDLERLFLKYKRCYWYGKIYGPIVSIGGIAGFMFLEKMQVNVYSLMMIVFTFILGVIFTIVQERRHNQNMKSVEYGLEELREFEKDAS